MIAEWLQETANTRVEGLEWLQHPHFQDWTVTLKKEEERERPHAVKKLTEKLLSMDILTDWVIRDQNSH